MLGQLSSRMDDLRRRVGSVFVECLRILNCIRNSLNDEALADNEQDGKHYQISSEIGRFGIM